MCRCCRTASTRAGGGIEGHSRRIAKPVGSDSPLFAVENLSVDFHGSGGNVTHAVKNVSFDIAKGETVALVGESGSGKTVSALSILKLLPYPAASHPSGRILFKNEDLMALPPG